LGRRAGVDDEGVVAARVVKPAEAALVGRYCVVSGSRLNRAKRLIHARLRFVYSVYSDTCRGGSWWFAILPLVARGVVPGEGCQLF